MKLIDQLELSGCRVFIRVDFNVPMRGGKITDTTRIDAARQTVGYALQHGGRVLLASHLGRPKGKPDPAFSLAPLVPIVAERLGAPVRLAPDCVGSEVESLA